jgi:hypothetical protein
VKARIRLVLDYEVDAADMGLALDGAVLLDGFATVVAGGVAIAPMGGVAVGWAGAGVALLSVSEGSSPIARSPTSAATRSASARERLRAGSRTGPAGVCISARAPSASSASRIAGVTRTPMSVDEPFAAGSSFRIDSNDHRATTVRATSYLDAVEKGTQPRSSPSDTPRMITTDSQRRRASLTTPGTPSALRAQSLAKDHAAPPLHAAKEQSTSTNAGDSRCVVNAQKG